MDKDWEKLRVWMIKERLEDELLRLFVHKHKLTEKCFTAGGTVTKLAVGVDYKKSKAVVHLDLK